MSTDIERKLKILFVEDNPHDAAWLEHMLESSTMFPFQLLPAQSMSGALAKLKDDPPHCVLLDLSLPDCAGVESVRRIVAADPLTPVVVLTGQDDELGLESVRNGAQDFLVKGSVKADEILRCVLWSVARAGVSASRTMAGGPPIAQLVTAPAVTIDREMRIHASNEAFDIMVKGDGRSVKQRPLTDFLPVELVFDTFQGLRPVLQGERDTTVLPFVLQRPGGIVEERSMFVVRVEPDAGSPAVLMVIFSA